MAQGQASSTVARERDEKGRIVESYPLDSVHETLIELESASTTEVADELGSAYETAYKKLRALEDDGRVTSRKIGNARLWLPAEDDDA